MGTSEGDPRSMALSQSPPHFSGDVLVLALTLAPA